MLCADSGPGPRPSAVAQSLSGMDAVQEPRSTQEPRWTYLRRVLRRWAGKGPAANSQRRGRGALTACGTRREPVPQPARAPHQTIGRRSFEKLPVVRCASDVQPMLHDRTRRIQRCSSHAHRPSPLVLARSPSRDPERHGCRAGAYMDVLAACPAMVGGQGPGSKLAASRTYLRRVSRWWACKGLHRIRRSAADPADDASSPAAPDIERHNMASWCF
ncbi:hypothetical protein FHY16_002376 [Xanthomonas campestris]|nr:hypothetical protein [Xanthomonas euroxanthea]